MAIDINKDVTLDADALEQVKGGAETLPLPKITPKISKESHGKL